MKGRYCYWTIASDEYAALAQTLVNSARNAGVTEDIHIWTDQKITGATCHELGVSTLSGRHFKLTFLRDRIRKLDHDYFIWLDADTCFVRHPVDPLRALQGSPLHVALETDLTPAGLARESWRGCSIEPLLAWMRLKGVRHRSIYSLSGGMFIVHREFVEQLLVLTKSFYAFCKQNGCSLNDEPLLAYAMHMICGDPSRHLLARHPDLWGTDWEGRFKERLPDGEPWPLRSPFAETELTVNPAIVHRIHSRAKVLALDPLSPSTP